MEYYNDKENDILELYKQIRLGESRTCLKCREECDLSLPIGCWCVGKHFYENEKRVLFVGKNARGNPGKQIGSFSNTFEVTRAELWEKSWAYWSYTRAITEAVYGKDSPEFIAFTNIVKCNDSPNVDTTSDIVKYNCISQMKVLRKEITLINPTHIIFYTHYDYDLYIVDVFDEYHTLSDVNKTIGIKVMPWLEADAYINGNRMKILRVGHPERKKKSDFVNSVVDWILNN